MGANDAKRALRRAAEYTWRNYRVEYLGLMPEGAGSWQEDYGACSAEGQPKLRCMADTERREYDGTFTGVKRDLDGSMVKFARAYTGVTGADLRFSGDGAPLQ